MDGGKGETFKGKYLAIKASNYANAQEFFGYKCVNWCARAIFFAKVSNCVRLLLKLVPAAAAAFVIKKKYDYICTLETIFCTYNGLVFYSTVSTLIYFVVY